MKAWEILKALEDGKKMKPISWNKNHYVWMDEDFTIYDRNNHEMDLHKTLYSYDEWEVYNKEANEMLNKFKDLRSKKKQNDFEQLYNKYKESVDNGSSGLTTTDKHDFIKLYSFYSEVISPDMMKLFKAMCE